MRSSSAAILRRLFSTSKKPPQVTGALLDFLELGLGLGQQHGVNGKQYTFGPCREKRKPPR
jgi:hypothetical protein